ncbi:hypothetical protein M409DRAFT_29507 [Zasmidium cellare ATCC 36951]|uniref:Uncharacterized protein n=1 Tax=Zasmidium cellare ATCC 36951 TaxID=1080233 RepID=A0A6A6C1B0_ZASCE|nr:uncharacterized protein M409DRAFT_29507 [Zasmidium cellare ATCC 36951]KAF2160058.1 hypothetical protein M409DRAFT_29507 [Zasmidium cellare ATCC 36951]
MSGIHDKLFNFTTYHFNSPSNSSSYLELLDFQYVSFMMYAGAVAGSSHAQIVSVDGATEPLADSLDPNVPPKNADPLNSEPFRPVLP